MRISKFLGIQPIHGRTRDRSIGLNRFLYITESIHFILTFNKYLRIIMFVFVLITLISKSEPEVINCKDLAIGQFVCQTPNVSNDTQVHTFSKNHVISPIYYTKSDMKT